MLFQCLCGFELVCHFTQADDEPKEMGVYSTYFVLLNTDFYNVASLTSRKMIKKIYDNGGIIGLHFDEVACEENQIEIEIEKEASILSEILEMPIRMVSMHRPSKKTLENNYKIKGMINSYSKEFFEEFKYVSDSRRNWREPVEEIAKSGKYNRLHILTHAFWYEEDELSARDAICRFIASRKESAWLSFRDNIRDIQEFVKREDLEYL